jgi:hypothetical protein
VLCVRDDVRVALQLEGEDVGKPCYRNCMSFVLAMLRLLCHLPMRAASSSLSVSCPFRVYCALVIECIVSLSLSALRPCHVVMT